MITIRKLGTLPLGTRRRKALRLLGELEARLREARSVEPAYFRDLGRMIAADSKSPGLTGAAEALVESFEASQTPELRLRRVNDLRHALLRDLGEEPGEWDLLAPLDRDTGPRLPCPPEFRPGIYLEDLRSPFNVGAIFRTAEAYCVEEILVSPGTPSPDGSRARRSSMGCVDRVPWARRALAEVETAVGAAAGLAVFALETGGTPLEEFAFPAYGVVLVGNEELGLSREARALAGDRICSIPMAGAKGSLNVAVSVGILLHAWWSRMQNPPP
jgi:RNA methyltransferase, TrmH family